MLEKQQIIEIGKRRRRSSHWNNEYTLLSLDNPEVYRDINGAEEDLPLFLGTDQPA